MIHLCRSHGFTDLKEPCNCQKVFVISTLQTYNICSLCPLKNVFWTFKSLITVGD